MKHVTIRDVARLAGVGIATASRALNNKEEVSPKTRKRVLDAAKKLGYIPNSLARGLISGRTKKIGIIITTILNPFYATVVSGIENVLSSQGYTLALYNSNEDPVKERESILTLRAQRVDGLILAPVEYQSKSVKYLLENQIPFVLVARNTIDKNTNYVICDDFKIGRIATEYLIKKGHKRILFINSWRSSSALLRLEGHKRSLLNSGLKINPKLIYSLSPNINLRDILDHVFSQKLKPTAIFCFCDSIALEVIKILKDKKIKIPDDVAVMGCDNLDFTDLIDPPLTTVDISKYEMGIKSARILIEKLKEEKKEPIQVMLEPKLIIRASA
ncbi:MAG: LacI family transcriptional regulator [Dictyoglomus sp.]|nr:LacI family transcriptional regulator [Dictyoglomus sp.]MCX7942470.1 LacI family transcriptional regulator [Dictyoglomaceae bacterium]MDW8189166.1 LacI family DNA-binding transcriptional regulator [Dictyoglomus sp.]